MSKSASNSHRLFKLNKWHKFFIITALLIPTGYALDNSLKTENASSESASIYGLYVYYPSGSVNPGVSVYLRLYGYISSSLTGKSATIYWRVNGGSWSSVGYSPSGSFNYYKIIGSFSAGTLVEYYGDVRGLKSGWPPGWVSDREPSSGYRSFTVVVPNQPPDITYVSPSTTSYNSPTAITAGGSFSVTSTVTDPQNTLEYRKYIWYTQAEGSSTWSGPYYTYNYQGVGTYTTTLATNIPYNMYYKFMVMAYDGQYTEYDPYNGYYYARASIDALNPTATTFTVPGQLVSTPTAFQVSATIQDLETGFTTDNQNKEFMWRVVGGNWNYVPGVYQSGTSSSLTYNANINNVPYGSSIEIKAHFFDIASNEGFSSQLTRTVTDGGAPIITSAPTLIGSATNYQPAVWQISVQDPEEFVLECFLDARINSQPDFYDSSTMQLVSGTTSKGVWEGTTLVYSKGDVLYTQARCRDNAGNWITATNTVGVTVTDATGPNYTLFTKEYDTVFTDEGDVTFSVYQWDDSVLLVNPVYLYYAYSTDGGLSYSSWNALGAMSYRSGESQLTNHFFGVMPKENIVVGQQYKFRVTGADALGNPGEYEHPTSYYSVIGTTTQDPSRVHQSEQVDVSAIVILTNLDTVYLELCTSTDPTSCIYDSDLTDMGSNLWEGSFTASGTYQQIMYYRIVANDTSAISYPTVIFNFQVEDGIAPSVLQNNLQAGPYDNMNTVSLEVYIEDTYSVVNQGNSQLRYRVWNPWLPGTAAQQWSGWGYYDFVSYGTEGDFPTIPTTNDVPYKKGGIDFEFPALPYLSVIEYDLIIKDAEGNELILSYNYTITVDARAPTVEFNPPAPNNLEATSDIEFMIKENGSGFDHATFAWGRYTDELYNTTNAVEYIDGVPTPIEDGWVAGWNFTTIYFDTSNVTEQTYANHTLFTTWHMSANIPRTPFDHRLGDYNKVKYNITVFDVAGNKYTITGYVSIDDKLPPAIAYVQPRGVPNNFETTEVDVTIEADPLVNGIKWGSIPLQGATAEYKVGAGTWLPASLSTQSTVNAKQNATVRVLIPPQIYTETVYLRFTIWDQSGNQIIEGDDLSFYYTIEDFTPPIISGFGQSISGDNKLDTIFSNTITDPDTGMSEVQFVYRVDSGDWINSTIVPTGSVYDFIIPKQTFNSFVEFVVEAKDNNGNIATYSNYYTSADLTGPVTSTSLQQNVIGESGSVLVDNYSRYINFDNFYVDPVVIVTSTTTNDNSGTILAQQPVVFNVSRFGFWIKQLEDGSGIDNDGFVNATNVNYLVAETGRYLLDGKYIEVGSLNTSSTFTQHSFNTSMTNPAVFTSTQTLNNGPNLALHSRINNTNSNSFEVVIEEGHNETLNYPLDELVGYIALEQGEYFSQIEVGSISTSGSVNITLTNSYSASPLGFAQVASKYDTNNLIAKSDMFNSSLMTIYPEEMNGNDGIHSSEDYFYLAIPVGDFSADVISGEAPVLVAEISDDQEVISVIIRYSLDGGITWSEFTMNETAYGTYEFILPIAISVDIEIISIDLDNNQDVYATTYRGLL